MTTVLIVLLLLISVLLIMVVLVQRGRGGGLAGAFGAGGGSSSAFGTKTGDVFTTITVILFVIFMLVSIWLSFRFHGEPEGHHTPRIHGWTNSSIDYHRFVHHPIDHDGIDDHNIGYNNTDFG